jgi:hypothetical protein
MVESVAQVSITLAWLIDGESADISPNLPPQLYGSTIFM